MTTDIGNVIQEAVKRGATNPPGRSTLHGETHWKCVAMVGFQIGRAMGLVGEMFDAEFLITFAQLHDICRLDDGEDLAHGARAAEMFTVLADSPGIPGFVPYSDRANDMVYALSNHTVGANLPPGVNINAGICWDADRCTLWRVGIEPERRYFSSGAGWLARYLGLELVRRQFDGTPFPSWSQIIKEMGDWRWP